jgi:membrane protein
MTNPFAAWKIVARGVRDLDLSRTAAALAFTTLLALVPLVSVAIATVARFPVFDAWLDALEKFLLRYMLPSSASTLVHTYVLGFAVHAAEVRGLSLAFVAVTGVLLFAMVEREINLIFRVRRGRSVLKRTPVYVLGLTLGPVLVGASIWSTTWILAQTRGILPRSATFGDFVIAPLPVLLTAIALALLYKIVPARPVRWVPALIAGASASAAFEAMKHGFAWYVTHVPTYELIYGALAALPLFLIWLHLCWVIVLAGALLTAALDGGQSA